MMRNLPQLVASVAIILAVTAAPRAQELDLGPEPGVLLLRNGQVIEGKITRAGDLYYVTLPNGEIRIRAADVEFCCPNLEEGYRSKRAAVRLGNVHDHLELAQWSLRHGLFGHAGRELADALDADPTHPMIGVLERRLKMAMQPPATPPQPAKPSNPAPSLEGLDRLVRGMPPGSVETFAERIQPLLMNNCTAAGCHGQGSETDFRLLRVPVGRPPSRRLTQRNLHATLQLIDREKPSASPLLTAPIRPHGTAKTAIFTDRQITQYRWMVDWVRRVAERPEPEVPATVAPQEKPPVRAMPAESGGFDSPRPEASHPADRQIVAEAVEKGLLPLRPKVKRGASLPRFVPADPFDPEIFNRRFFGEASGDRRDGD